MVLLSCGRPLQTLCASCNEREVQSGCSHDVVRIAAVWRRWDVGLRFARSWSVGWRVRVACDGEKQYLKTDRDGKSCSVAKRALRRTDRLSVVVKARRVHAQERIGRTDARMFARTFVWQRDALPGHAIACRDNEWLILRYGDSRGFNMSMKVSIDERGLAHNPPRSVSSRFFTERTLLL